MIAIHVNVDGSQTTKTLLNGVPNTTGPNHAASALFLTKVAEMHMHKMTTLMVLKMLDYSKSIELTGMVAMVEDLLVI